MSINREMLYREINEKGIDHEDTIKVAAEVDKEILNEFIKDPVIESLYLKIQIKSKDEEIRRLQRRVIELTDIAAMQCEVGTTAITAIRNVVNIAMKEGITSEIGIYSAR